MSRITVKEASKLTGIQPGTIHQQIHRGTHVGQLFSKDAQGHWRADEKRVIHAAKVYKRRLINGGRGERKIGFRVSDEERKAIESKAAKAGLTLAEWCRVSALGK